MKTTIVIFVALSILIGIFYTRIFRRINPFGQRFKLVDYDGEERFGSSILLELLCYFLIIYSAIGLASEIQQKSMWILAGLFFLQALIIDDLKETINEKYIFSKQGVFHMKDIIEYKFTDTVDEKLLGESKPLIKFKNYDKHLAAKNEACDFLIINLKSRNKAEELTYESQTHKLALRVPKKQRDGVETLLNESMSE